MSESENVEQDKNFMSKTQISNVKVGASQQLDFKTIKATFFLLKLCLIYIHADIFSLFCNQKSFCFISIRIRSNWRESCLISGAAGLCAKVT